MCPRFVPAAELPGWVIIKEEMTFFTVSCSSYYCHITNYSKTEGVKQPLLNFAHGFVVQELRKGTSGSSRLGYLTPVAVRCGLGCRYLEVWLGCTSERLAQMAGSWCCQPNTCVWPLRFGCLKITRLIWRLAFPWASILRESGEAAWPSLTLEFTQYGRLYTLSMEVVTAHPDTGEGI